MEVLGGTQLVWRDCDVWHLGTWLEGWPPQGCGPERPHVARFTVADLGWCSGLQELVSPVNKEKGVASYDSLQSHTLSVK